MTQSMQPILQHLFQANSLEDVSMERLEAFVEEYPSFGIGHFLLSRKLRVEDAGRYSGETQRTNLYFTNPFWLQWMLENSGTNGAARDIAPTATAPETFAAEPFVSEPFDVTEEPGLAPEEPIRDEEPPFVLEEAATLEETATPVEKETKEGGTTEEEIPLVAETASIAPEESLPVAEQPAPLPAAEQPASSSAAELLMQSLREAHGLRETLMRINGDLESFKEGSAAATPQEEEEEPAPEEEETREDQPAFSSGAIGAAVERAALAAGRMEEEQKPNPVQDGAVVTHAIALAEQTFTAAEQPNTPAEQLVTPMEQHANPAEQSITPAEQPIVFEPYHTIDYFASQGIKLTLDENPSDSLGKQLKSFTDWLKVMRRLPQKDREIVPDIAAERTVQTIAAHSIEGKEVVTETMAEVLAKQGMPEKAREVYNKLILLNPGKRAYFAAKIEQLNIH
jgi:hypothetical protein